MMIDTIEIPISRTKVTLLLLVAIIFVIVGILFLIDPETFQSSIFKNKEIIRIIGIAAVLFFGLGSIFLFRKLFDNKIGLIIDHNGITDNSSATSIGLIEWKDIKRIETLQIASTKILMIITDKPEKYIEKAKGKLAKRAMKTNYKMYGSPISITSNSLKIKFNDLEKLVSDALEKRS